MNYLRQTLILGAATIFSLNLVLPMSQAAEPPPVTPLLAPAVPAPKGPAVAEPLSTLGTARLLDPAPARNVVPLAASTEAPQARGLIRAVREATLSAAVTGQIIKMPFSEGTSFKKGDLLVEFDCERPQAELRAAQAAMQVEQKTVETNEELERFNSIGKFDLLISVSKLNKAKAEVEALNAQIKGCRITAPFNGGVIERHLRLHESASPGEPLLRIIDTSGLELDVIVPSQWLQWLAPGTPFRFKVDETGDMAEAVVERLLPSVDPVSKTIKIIGRFSARPAALVIPGMSGSARFVREGVAKQ
jgi:membrane fusion protein (multidrug efflux system)